MTEWQLEVFIALIFEGRIRTIETQKCTWTCLTFCTQHLDLACIPVIETRAKIVSYRMINGKTFILPHFKINDGR